MQTNDADRRIGRMTRATAVCLGLAVATAGCQGQDLVGSGSAQDAGTAAAVPPVSFTSSVKNGAKDVRPDADVTVGASNGTLHAVQLRGGGRDLKGDTDGGQWRLNDLLAPETPYTMTVTGVDAAGNEAKKSFTFTTVKPKVEATYRVTPDKETVGVGMPVTVTFDSAVKTPAMKAAVEKRLSIKTEPQQVGSWGWTSDNQVAWRPADFWKPNTKVTVNAPLRGVETGDGKWVTEDKGASFTIAKRSRISTVDIANHTMTVRENGKVVDTYPVSSGRPEKNYPTRTGTKVITEKRPFMVMDAATLGVPKDDPNYYRTEVRYAMRVTNTGEFLHSAPWSVSAQGRRNVSHGCVNMGPGAAKEMFSRSIVGDVVDFKNGPRKMKPGDGLSVWLYSFEDWKATSALAKPADKKAPKAKKSAKKAAPSSPAAPSKAGSAAATTTPAAATPSTSWPTPAATSSN